jgi:hypothetical protein
MREQLSSKRRDARHFTPRGIGEKMPSLLLIVGVALVWFDPVLAQAPVPPTAQHSFGVGVISSFNSATGQRLGIPLGSTEIATQGIAPVLPSHKAGVPTCSDFGNARSSSTLFDGGGLSGSMPLPCARSRVTPSSGPSLSSAGRVRIPLGATEFGNPGISPLTLVPSDGVPTPTGSIQPGPNNTGIP